MRSLSERVEVAEDVRYAASAEVSGVTGDVRVRVALEGEAGLGEVHDPLPVQVGLLRGIPNHYIREPQPRRREQQPGIDWFGYRYRRRWRDLGGSWRGGFLYPSLPETAWKHGHARRFRPRGSPGSWLLI